MLKRGIIPNEPKKNCYVDIMNGEFEHKKNGVRTGEISMMYDYSRYKYLLDADFPLSSKCCDIMKKHPLDKFKRESKRVPITGQMASESRLRTQKWLKNGCNLYEGSKKVSNPMSFWTEQDILLYIKLYGIKICSVYGDIVEDQEENLDGQMCLFDYDPSAGIFDKGRPPLKTTGCTRTGCMFCGYGCHLEKGEGRFERMKRTHPKQYEWIMKPWSEGGLGYKEVIDWINEHGNLHIKY